MPETYAPIILVRKAKQLRKETGDENYYTPIEKEPQRTNNILTAGSAVLVTFTLGAYELADGAAISYGVKLGVSLNAQAVVLLSEPLPASNLNTIKSSNAPLHLGVLSEAEEEGEEEEIDEDDTQLDQDNKFLM